ncbi:arginine deiminase [Blattamonas nauphoetae]|uniref:Arginine deiminase n=1 Tax=Blattamonas nauphoetae TaxID=2049346 RepID=A0ABQ9YKT4_9EUKA|nr:arginine deiminase [Blattamonas nauphoetae]
MQDLRRKQIVSLEKQYQNLQFVRETLEQTPIFQYDEDDIPRLVITHEPEFAQTLGSLHPEVFLFSKAVDAKRAKYQHRFFRETIRQKSGSLVFTVRQILEMGTDDLHERYNLEQLALTSIVYRLSDEVPIDSVSAEERRTLTDEYKKDAIKKMTITQLIDVIMSRPTVIIKKAENAAHLCSNKVEMDPLTNLTFCRDQQITTAKGVVLGSMALVQRVAETTLMRFVFNKLRIPIVGEIDPSTGGKLEGGDFLPGGKKICFIGVGLRTNMTAIEYMLKNDLFGTDYVCVVKDTLDLHPDRMHLDTVFGLLDKENVIMSDDVIGPTSDRRRLVWEYRRVPVGAKPVGGTEVIGHYELSQQDVEFSEYLKARGYHVISIPARLQLILGVNVLNLGKGNVCCTNEETARIIIADGHFKGSIYVVPFDEITAMNGGVHCATFVVRHPPETQFSVIPASHTPGTPIITSAASPSFAEAMRRGSIPARYPDLIDDE